MLRVCSPVFCILALLIVFLATPAAMADIYVAPAPTGDNVTGDGTVGNPYATITHAYNVAPTQGETIRALPGTYFDVVVAIGGFVEVSPGVFEEKWVDIVADDPDNTLTTITGNGFNPTVTVGGLGGSISGFTITGGGTGILGVGTVTISGNRIQGNNGSYGGGIAIESSTCDYGIAVATVTDNLITNNNATTDGGGIYVEAGVDDADCQVADASVLVENNTVTLNTANDDGAGLEIVSEAFDITGKTEIRVVGNTITNNSALDDGGGGRFFALGRGNETVYVSGNTFDANSAGADGAGLVGQVEVDELANHRMLIEDNSVTSNVALGDGGGMFLRLQTQNLFGSQFFSLIASRNIVDGNSATGALYGGGGIVARHDASEADIFSATTGEFRVRNNIVSFNDSALYGGGMSVAAESNLQSPGICEIIALQAESRVDVEGNVIYRNDAPTGGIGVGGGVYVSADACVNSSALVVFTLNTIVKNDTDDGAGGIHTNFFSDFDSSPEVRVSHSIIYDNKKEGLGGPVPVSNFLVDVDYSNIDANDTDYASWIGNRTGIDGNVSVNPLFEDVGGDDYRLQSGSPVIEAGSRLISSIPLIDFEGSPRVVDADGDGLFIVDMGADEFFDCDDPDNDGYGSGPLCTTDNCFALYNPGQNDCDLDLIGDVCDSDTIDKDKDGVDVACDSDDNDPTECGDVDNDTCEDCVSGFSYPANDGADFDFDGLCNDGDDDDDADGAEDGIDAQPLNPFICGDADDDGCGDDCVTGTYEPFNDGPDLDGDGICDVGDPDIDGDGVDNGDDSDPTNANVCRDLDQDTCDDCSSGTDDPFNDGVDGDGDGVCAAGDSNDADPNACADDDGDACDDCVNGQYDPADDGPDSDFDGTCDFSDPDDDNDGVLDDDDCAPLVNSVSNPVGDVGSSVRLGPAKDRVSWVNIPDSNVYNVYRGTRPAHADFVYNHSCIQIEVAAPDVFDASVPGSGDLSYYLVSGTNSCGGEGTLGNDSAGSPRPNDAPCPAPALDADADGVPGIDDNCPDDPNPMQEDADQDGVGDACDNCLVAANVGQEDHDGDTIGDACDLCTDTDGDGLGDPGFPSNTCDDDNCPEDPNPGQFDGDGDGLGNVCDVCPNDPLNDDDADEVCFADDNCPDVPNPSQEDFDDDGEGDHCDLCTDQDDDGFGDAGFPFNTCPLDNCPLTPNDQADFDGDGDGDVCDLCTDADGDGFGNTGFPDNTCPDDNCPFTSNVDQVDTDIDGLGNACDPCFDNPDLECVACFDQDNTDPDGDGACELEDIYAEPGTVMDWLANSDDPGIGIDWVAEDYVIDGNWGSGPYGVGYEANPQQPNAENLIATEIPPATLSVYTRVTFNVASVAELKRVKMAVDYDDGYQAWINGTEVFRSAEMPAAGDPDYDTVAAPHESSNLPQPDFSVVQDLTSIAIPLLSDGPNVLAIGAWNTDLPSSDLILVPRLVGTTTLDNCEGLSNPDQADADGDELGDACDLCTDSDGDGFGDPGFPLNTCPEDICPFDFDPDQLDSDDDGAGDACDVCPDDPLDPDMDADGVCDTTDNCIDTPNPLQEDLDLDGIGDACDECTDPDGDGFGTPGFPASICPEDNCPDDDNAGQEDGDGDLVGDICDNCIDDPNTDQANADGDALGDICDPCLSNPDPGCVACPAGTDTDGDGVCILETVLVEEGSGMDYLDNQDDPGLGLTWVAEDFVIDGNWLPGFYGVGYDENDEFPTAKDLITTTVPFSTASIYTRLTVDVTLADVQRMTVGADYDDGYMLWINGVEIFRSPEMPPGDPDWDTFPDPSESSNLPDPVYEPLTDITAAVQGVLQDGDNVLAIGVWNRGTFSSDLVLVPRLAINSEYDNCPDDPNPGQEDTDGDGVGDACDLD